MTARSALFLELFGMTTSISSPESSALVSPETQTRLTVPGAGYVTYRIRHTLASRFAFLIVCLAIILSALAYGTVHYWALTVFFLGAITLRQLVDAQRPRQNRVGKVQEIRVTLQKRQRAAISI